MQAVKTVVVTSEAVSFPRAASVYEAMTAAVAMQEAQTASFFENSVFLAFLFLRLRFFRRKSSKKVFTRPVTPLCG